MLPINPPIRRFIVQTASVPPRSKPLERMIAEETVRELMNLLTERQRQMIHRIYFQQHTQKEVSHELGITVPAVSKCISQAIQKMKNNSDDSARALEKGDWKYAW